MEIYGLKGVIYSDNRHDLRVRMTEGYDGFHETLYHLDELKPPLNDPFAYLKAVLRNDLTPEPFGLYTLENNMIVMEVLEAAILSANSGRTIYLDKKQD